MVKIEDTRLNYVIVSRNDLQGKTSYKVICSAGEFRFRTIDSVLEFLKMNEFGYIKGC